jgi:hypothetical protein
LHPARDTVAMLDSVYLRCPWCGERFEALADASGGASDYVEDCPVCCRPITFQLDADADGNLRGLDAQRED